MLSPAIGDKVEKGTAHSVGRLLREELRSVKGICAVDLIRRVKRNSVWRRIRHAHQ